ncbi:MAG TPA: hypothetical protein VES02_00130, partial [Dermatophilaceae bacterium]|nr:hypothetical protein [Dermatophilaceae bacterium]
MDGLLHRDDVQRPGGVGLLVCCELLGGGAQGREAGSGGQLIEHGVGRVHGQDRRRGLHGCQHPTG